MQMRRPRWRVDICLSLSKFTVDFTQGRKAPHSQHRDLPLSQKVVPLLAMQTVRVRALMGKQAGGALCSPLSQCPSLSDKFEVLPRLSLKESALLSQVGFLPGCGQPTGEPKKAHSHEIFPRTRLAGDPPKVICCQVAMRGSQMAVLTTVSSLSRDMAAQSSAKSQEKLKNSLGINKTKTKPHKLKSALWLRWARQA